MDLLDFYSRNDIQEELLRLAKDREVAVRFGDKGFGKRPDVLQFKGDIVELVKQGTTSFHFSEERWENPLALVSGMTKKQLDGLRKGWDLVLDIDGPFEYSRVLAGLVVDALKFNDVENVSIKFSGNKGFHVCVPFETFPDTVHNIKIKYWFPDGPRIIAGYLRDLIREHFSEELLKEGVDKIAEVSGKGVSELNGDGFDPYRVADIDAVLISSRHMFRAPYSHHEKSGLISVPFDVKDLGNFDKSWAKMENVKVRKFFDFEQENDASGLLIKSFDWSAQNKKKDLFFDSSLKEVEYDTPSSAIEENHFPPCILKILEGGLEDGKKRSLFILINFLRSAGWSIEDIKKKIIDWNKTHPDPLRENYIVGQINWHKRQKDVVPPPNCGNAAYYKDLRVCVPNNVCKRYKNPINYTLRRFRIKK